MASTPIARVLSDIVEQARHLKYDLVRLLVYRPRYGDLHPPGYSRRRFRAAATRAADEYVRVTASIGAAALDRFDEEYCHTYWSEQKAVFARSLVAGLPEDFLDDSIVRPNMVRRGWSQPQVQELEYLQTRSADLRLLLDRFRESRVGQPFLECQELACSTTTLGHLYYLVRILESFPTIRDEPHTVVELGGGYGSFARLYRLLVPSAKYVVFDFPQFLALQSLYLRLNDQHAEIQDDPTLVSSTAEDVELVPVQLLANTDLKADLFVSHFALSETPAAFQRLVADRHFFGADGIYLTGQRTGAQPGHAWTPHQLLLELVGREFAQVTVEDFNISWAYELVARRSSTRSSGPDRSRLARY